MNIDADPLIADQLGVKSIPAVVAFQRGTTDRWFRRRAARKSNQGLSGAADRPDRGRGRCARSGAGDDRGRRSRRRGVAAERTRRRRTAQRQGRGRPCCVSTSTQDASMRPGRCFEALPDAIRRDSGVAAAGGGASERPAGPGSRRDRRTEKSRQLRSQRPAGLFRSRARAQRQRTARGSDGCAA